MARRTPAGRSDPSGSRAILPLHADQEHAVPKFGLERQRFDIGRQLDLAFKSAVGDLHVQLPATGFEATIAPFAANAHESAMHREFNVLRLDSGEFKLDQPTVTDSVNVGD